MRRPIERLARRMFDAAFSVIVLAAFAPLFVALAVFILFEDGRPVFFLQERVGAGGRPFRIFKFRTMKAGSSGRLITAAGDSRVTRVGAFLRKFKLDEFAQFFNVIRGDMSICGPRPEVPRFVNLYDPLWRAVLLERPGITDPASLVYRHEEEVLSQSADPERAYRESILPEKLRLSARYLRTRTLWSDLKLIALTARCSLSRRPSDRRVIEQILFSGGF